MIQELYPDSVKDAFLQAMNLAVPVLRVTRLTKGYSTECWRIDLVQSSFLMKIALRDQDTHTFARLTNSVNIAIKAGVVTPMIIDKTLGSTINGRNLLIQEWLEGIDCEEILPKSSQIFRDMVFYRLGEVLGSLHAGTSSTHFSHIDGSDMSSDIKTYLQTILVKVVKDTTDTHLWDSRKMHVFEQSVSSYIQKLSKPVIPRLSHLDIHLPNMLVLPNERVGLLDFEHARFADPVEDFIKLHVWVFPQYPEQKAMLLAGYSNYMTWCEEAQVRLKIHLAIYLFSALVYFIKYEPTYVCTWLVYMRNVLKEEWDILL